MSAEEVGVAVAWGDESSDAELITAARGGSSAAFGALYERHAAAARTVARQYTRSSADAEDVVSDAFARVYSIVRGGGGPDVAFRAYLFTVVRRLAHTRVEAGRRVQPTDDMATFETAFGSVSGVDDPALAGFERGVVAKAYGSLPERWQAVLWYTEIERLQPAQVGPLLGLTANGVAALAYRAREGLREAYLQQHLVAAPSDTCRTVNDKLGSYVRGGLAKRESAQVRAHLETCETCRSLVLELGDVNHGLRGIIAPLVLGVAGLGALAAPLPVGVLVSIGAGAGVGGGAAGTGVLGTAGSGVAAVTGSGSVGGGLGAGAAGAGAAGAGTAGAAGSGAAAGGVTSLASAGAVGTSGAAGSLAGGAGSAVVGAGSTLAGSSVAGSTVAGGIAGGAAGAHALAGGTAGSVLAGSSVLGSTVGGTLAGSGAAGVVAGSTTTAGIAGATTAGLAGAGTGLAGAGTSLAGVGVAGATGAAAATGTAATAAGATALAGAGAASSAVAAGGIGGFVAAIPGGVAGMVTTAVVGVSLAVGGVMAEPAETRPPFSSAPPTATPGTGPGTPPSGPTGSSGGAAAPSPPAATGTGALFGAPVLAIPGAGQAPSPGASPGPGQDGAPSGRPGPAPAVPPTTGGGAVDPTPVPLPTPADLAIRSAGTVVLVAGTDTAFAITLVNTGATDVTDLRAALLLPSGVEVAAAGAGDWQPCADDAAGPPAEFCLDALPGGGSAVLSAVLRASADAPVDTASTVAVSVSGEGSTPRTLSVAATVSATPADLALLVAGPVALDQDVAGVAALAVTNRGRTPARDVVVSLMLPAGVAWVGDQGATQPWSCARDGARVTCRLAELPARDTVDLRLRLAADASAVGVPGLAVELVVAHAGGATRSDTLPLSVRPAPQQVPEVPPVPELPPPVVPPVPAPPVDAPPATTVEPPAAAPPAPPAPPVEPPTEPSPVDPPVAGPPPADA